MKNARVYLTNGQEVTTTGLTVTGLLAGTSMDQALSEFFRTTLAAGGVAGKGIIPYGMFTNNANDPQSAGIVTSSGTTDRRVYIYPFRALVATVDHTTSSPETAWTHTHSVAVVPPDAGGSTLFFGVQLDATASDKRIDLIYCKISIDQVSDSAIRYVRDPTTGVVSSPTITNELSDTFELLVAKGTGTAGTPVRPSLPSDTSTEFYIPLAFVFLPTTFGASGQVNNILIQEVAPVIPIARATGSATLRPANGMNKTGGYVTSVQDFTTTGRPFPYLPPTFTGKEELVVCCTWESAGNKMPPVSTTSIIDDSVDWRKRIFKWTAVATSNASSFAWAFGGATTPGYAQVQGLGVGQSFFADGGAFSLTGGVVANVQVGDMAHPVQFFVDLSTGTLKCKVGTSPDSTLLIWIEASGQYANAS